MSGPRHSQARFGLETEGRFWVLALPGCLRTFSSHTFKEQDSQSKQKGEPSFAKWVAALLIGAGGIKILHTYSAEGPEGIFDLIGATKAFLDANTNFIAHVEERFEIGEVLGKGGFAVVYKATDKTQGKSTPIALKVMSKDNPESFRVMEEEVKVMRAAGIHENIVSFHGVVETPTEWCLLLDLADGGALFDRVIEEGKLTEAQASSYVLQLTQALLHLHRRGICHADVKPENLLLTSADPLASIKLCDFGMARELRPGEAEEWFGDRIGTLDYWAPEMVRKLPCGTPVDMWALGVVVYIMLCGCNPFNPYGVASDAQILTSIAAGKVDTSNPVWRHLSAPCRDLIMRLMAVDPTQRLTAADALQHAWLTGAAPAASLPEVHRQRLRGYQALNGLRVAVQALAIDVDRLFSVLDRDRSGFLSADELREAFTVLGVALSADALDAILRLVDTGRDGTIGRAQFQRMITGSGAAVSGLRGGGGGSRGPALSEEELRVLFDMFDVNKNGTISPAEMQHVLNMLGRKMTLRRATSIFAKAPGGSVAPGGGMELDFKQFCKIMRMNLLNVPVDD
jgi:calcium-dependent protein kinase